MHGRRVLAVVASVVLLVSCAPAPSPSGDGSPSETPFGSGIPSESASPSAGPTASATPEMVIYVVRSGDTLFSIGQAWGVSVEQLRAWNAARYPSLSTDPATLQVGWELIVSGDPNATPRPTAVRSEERRVGKECRL